MQCTHQIVGAGTETVAKQAVWITRNNTVYDKMIISSQRLFTHSFKAHVRLLHVVKKEWDKSALSQKQSLFEDHEESANRSLDFALRKTGEKKTNGKVNVQMFNRCTGNCFCIFPHLFI